MLIYVVDNDNMVQLDARFSVITMKNLFFIVELRWLATSSYLTHSQVVFFKKDK